MERNRPSFPLLGGLLLDCPAIAIGVAEEEAGAYGAAMASNYNGRLRPAEVVLEGGELRLSRRRETLDDFMARDA